MLVYIYGYFVVAVVVGTYIRINNKFHISIFLKLHLYACLAPIYSFSLLCRLKSLISQTRHGTVHIELLNIR